MTFGILMMVVGLIMIVVGDSPRAGDSDERRNTYD